MPRERQERYFIEFAKIHTWDPLVTGVVQERFESICLNRTKDMVNKARTTQDQPNWIGDTLWKQMTDFWNTEEAKEKSATTSAARMSDRNGLSPHVHFSGQKLYIQIQQKMEEELGRPVSVGESFIKTHTKSDGTFVDRKSKTVAEVYKKKLEEKMADLGVNFETSDGTSPPVVLSVEEENELFLQATFTNERGIPYGIGSLSQTTGKGSTPEPLQHTRVSKNSFKSSTPNRRTSGSELKA